MGSSEQEAGYEQEKEEAGSAQEKEEASCAQEVEAASRHAATKREVEESQLGEPYSAQ